MKRQYNLNPGLMAITNGPLLKFRHHMENARQRHEQVIPYPYIHLVSFLTTGYLAFFAFEKASLYVDDSNTFVSLVVPCMATIFFAVSALSIVLVGANMQDPFGSDITDFPCLAYCIETAGHTKVLVDAKVEMIREEKSAASK